MRFSDPTWRLNPFYRRSLQAYMAWQHQLQQWVEQSNLPEDDRARARFILAMLTDAIAPSNSPLNPLALKELFNTGGNSLVKGLRQLLDDVVNNGGMPRQVNKLAFEVGRNLATTAGAVVYRNELLELIQYKSMSEKQYERPLLIVPPQINKYYIFDLSADKSFVQYALKNGLQVFVISWRNPDARHREWGLSTYVEALEQAMDVCREITGSRSVNLLGACAGGLTNAALQGHLQAKRQLRKVSSATYLVSLLHSQVDSTPMLFADEKTLEAAKRRSYQQGVLDGRDMAKVFAWMRPNDLIWNYWVNNYLLGNEPPVFDILHWNNDTTRLPAALHGEFIDMFKNNPLTRAGALEVCGTPVDLKQVTCDLFCVAGTTDHITPWEACYKSAHLFGGKCEFVLSNSGHIQSILNPPGNPKGRYMTNSDLPVDPKAWLASCTKHADSWWLHWQLWQTERAGKLKKTPSALGNKAFPAREAAPGTYVHER